MQIPRNRILFGAPGTGKSYTLNEEAFELLENDEDYERVTFHPDYGGFASNTDCVFIRFLNTKMAYPDSDSISVDSLLDDYKEWTDNHILSKVQNMGIIILTIKKLLLTRMNKKQELL